MAGISSSISSRNSGGRMVRMGSLLIRLSRILRELRSLIKSYSVLLASALKLMRGLGALPVRATH